MNQLMKLECIVNIIYILFDRNRYEKILIHFYFPMKKNPLISDTESKVATMFQF